MAGPEKDSTHQNLDQQLAELDQRFLDLASERVDLLRKWTASTSLDAKLDPPKPLWAQIADAEKLAKPETKRLIRSFVGETCLAAAAEKTTVAYLGPVYSYSYLAAVKYFSEAVHLQNVSTISAVFEEIIRNQATFGVVPIENSTDGRIVDTLSMFAKLPVRICGEVLLPIHHCLLGRGDRDSISEVYSKPQALSQCRGWLSQHLPEAKLIEISSTTAAARLASEKPNVAAIAAREAGIHYGLDILAENIEDNPNNVTRFAVIGSIAPKPTTTDKTSIMFQIPHQSGALAEAMLFFSRNQLNLTWIESFPLPNNRSEYLFFVELEGHEQDSSVQSALKQLRDYCLRLEMLGSYPRAEL